MHRMMLRRLQQPDVLQEGDEPAVFLPGAVRPFVDFVGVRADNNKQPYVPRQQIQAPRDQNDGGRKEREVPGALPPSVPRHVAGQVMVDDIRLTHERPDQWRVFPHIGVFRPMNNPCHEVSQRHHQQSCHQHNEKFCHTPG